MKAFYMKQRVIKDLTMDQPQTKGDGPQYEQPVIVDRPINKQIIQKFEIAQSDKDMLENRV